MISGPSIVAALPHPLARILIVDDEPCNRDLLELMLAPEGFLLETASSGEDALDMMAREPPDLVLLDIMMPGMDGYRVIKRMRANPATINIPIIVLTARYDHNTKILGLRAGAEDVLTKPIDRTELSIRVRNLLRFKACRDFQDKYSQMAELERASRPM